MSNKNIITEFERLIAFIENLNDNETNIKTKTSNNFRLKQLKNVVSIIKSYPSKITLNNYKELVNISGIGKNSINRIKEILENGSLEELGDFIDTKKEEKKILDELSSVINIGDSLALDFYNKGIKSVKQLKKEIKEEKIEVNDKIKLGLKYYKKINTDIPRDDIINFYNKFSKIIDKNLIFEFTGSYRRGNPTSGDIDILIAKTTTSPSLDSIITLLKNKKLLVDDMTDNTESKYMGFMKLSDYIVRIDIRYIPIEDWICALVYFTGSKTLNQKMRMIAKKKNLKLNEYGLFKKNGEKIIIKSEKDLFDKLDMKYLEPNERI